MPVQHWTLGPATSTCSDGKRCRCISNSASRFVCRAVAFAASTISLTHIGINSSSSNNNSRPRPPPLRCRVTRLTSRPSLHSCWVVLGSSVVSSQSKGSNNSATNYNTQLLLTLYIIVKV